jgi:hypothetical protein
LCIPVKLQMLTLYIQHVLNTLGSITPSIFVKERLSFNSLGLKRNDGTLPLKIKVSN